MNQDWPVADLDPVRRMRVLAAATPGVAYAEKLIPAPFSVVWETASDLEHELPRMITDLRSFEITSTRGERLTARARGRLGQHARFDVVLRPGWCVMQSRFLIGGMAAAPKGGEHPVRLPRRPPPPRNPATRPSAPPGRPVTGPAAHQAAGAPAPGPLTRPHPGPPMIVLSPQAAPTGHCPPRNPATRTTMGGAGNRIS